MDTEQARERLIAERDRLTQVRDAATRLSTPPTRRPNASSPAPTSTPPSRRPRRWSASSTSACSRAWTASSARCRPPWTGSTPAPTGSARSAASRSPMGGSRRCPPARYCVEDQAKATRGASSKAGKGHPLPALRCGLFRMRPGRGSPCPLVARTPRRPFPWAASARFAAEVLPADGVGRGPVVVVGVGEVLALGDHGVRATAPASRAGRRGGGRCCAHGSPCAAAGRRPRPRGGRGAGAGGGRRSARR